MWRRFKKSLRRRHAFCAIISPYFTPKLVVNLCLLVERKRVEVPKLASGAKMPFKPAKSFMVKETKKQKQSFIHF